MIMKNKFFNRLFLLSTALITMSVNVWSAEETVSWNASSGALGSTISSVNGTAIGTISTGSFQWNYTRTLVLLTNNKSDYVSFANNIIQLGSGNAMETLLITTSNIPGTINSIVIACGGTSTSHALSVSVGGTSYTLDPSDLPAATIVSGTATAVETVTATGASSGEIRIAITNSNNTKKAIYIKSITVTYEEGSSCEEPTVLTEDGACQTNTDYDLAENCFLSDNTSAVAFTCTSGNASSCTISGSTFRATAAGTYTIKATQAEDGTYCPVEETFNVVVSAPTVQCTVTFLNNGQPVTSIGTNGVKTYNKGDALGTLPTQGDMTPCDGTSITFMGWYAGEPIREKQSTRPTLVTSSTTVNGDMTLRAVWAREQ